jgi:hypothetical protein
MEVNDSTRRLHKRLDRLEHEYRLARLGLLTGVILYLFGTAVAGMAWHAFVSRGEGFLSGTHLVIIFVALSATWISYFSFIFGRRAKAKAEFSETGKSLELKMGGSVRSARGEVAESG